MWCICYIPVMMDDQSGQFLTGFSRSIRGIRRVSYFQ